MTTTARRKGATDTGERDMKSRVEYLEQRNIHLEQGHDRLDSAVRDIATNLTKLTEVHVTQAHHTGALERIAAEVSEARKDINGVGGRVNVVESVINSAHRTLDAHDRVLNGVDGKPGLVAIAERNTSKLENYGWALRLIGTTLAGLLIWAAQQWFTKP